MDLPELPESLHVAGRKFLDQLGALGLHPEGLLWVYDCRQQEFQLQLLWSGVDRYGPYSLTKLIFSAYRAAALPRDIDPFSIHVRSPKFGAGGGMMNVIRGVAKYQNRPEEWMMTEGDDVNNPVYRARVSWIYRLATKPQSPTNVVRDWKRFNESVTALAA